MKIKLSKNVLLASIIAFVLMSCKNEASTELDYCKMLKLDQSYVSNGGTVEELESDNLKRKDIFKDNLDQIIQYSKTNGFPEMGSLQTSGLDSCRNWAVMITLFHVGQTQPILFFEKETQQLLEKEIKEGRLKSGSLFPPLREGFEGHEFCLDRKEEMYNALIAWQLKVEELPEIKFVDCSQ